MQNEIDQSLIHLEDSENLDRLIDYIEESDMISFDIETDGVVEKICNVIGIALWGDAHEEGLYIPLNVWNIEEQKLFSVFDDNDYALETLEEILDMLSHKRLIMHNGVFDVACIYHSYGIDLTNALYADTLLMKHTIDEEPPFALKVLAVRWQEQLEIDSEKIANEEQIELKASVIANGGSWTKTQKDMYKADLNVLAKYAIADVDLTARLFDYLDQELEKQGLDAFFYDFEVMPLYRKATIPMKLNGVFIDVKYFENLEKNIEDDIIELENKIFDEIGEKIQPRIEKILDKKIKVTKTGNFALEVLRYYNLPVPINEKTGKPTLAKKALQSLDAEYPGHKVLRWLLEDKPLPESDVFEIRKEVYLRSYPDNSRIFNLSSTKDLAWLLFEAYKQEATAFSRKTGAPKVDQDSLGEFDLPFIPKLIELKKHQKILNTYVKPILETHVDGQLFPPMKQHGTTSGRYSCGSDKENTDKVAKEVNLQTLPSKDVRIKQGFIAPKGYKIVNADFSSLEPRIFAWVSNSPGLIEIYQKGFDLYSQIAIDVFGLEGVSADPKSKKYLKEVDPDMRDKAKVFSLAVVYGANAWRISSLMGIEPDEAQEIIDAYLDSYPELRTYMFEREHEAKHYGMVYTDFGRIRHLKEAKKLYNRYKDSIKSKSAMNKKAGKEEGPKLYYKYRNLVNNARNFPIQGTAAHMTNAAIIDLADSFKEHKIDGWIALQIHDEIATIVREDQAELVSELLRKSMEENHIAKELAKDGVPMIAEPKIADNFAEAK